MDGDAGPAPRGAACSPPCPPPPSLPLSGPKPSVSTSAQVSQTAACCRSDQLKRRTELPAPYLPHPTGLLSAPSTPAPVLIDCAGMDYETQSKLINTYRGTFPMYSDSGGRNGVPAPLQLHRSLHSIHAQRTRRAMPAAQQGRLSAHAVLACTLPCLSGLSRGAGRPPSATRSSGGAQSRRSTFLLPGCQLLQCHRPTAASTHAPPPQPLACPPSRWLPSTLRYPSWGARCGSNGLCW